MKVIAAALLGAFLFVGVAQAAVDTDAKLKVVSVLESLPGLGKVKARRVLDEAGVSDTRRVQGLGLHQKEKLLDLLDGSKP